MNDVLAYDLGGSSLRLAIINNLNEVTKLVRIPMQIPRGRNGEYEADPQHWWDNFLIALSQLADRGANLDAVGAIVGCGFTRTQVAINETGDVVHPAITFQDSRGTGALTEYLEKATAGLSDRVANLSAYHPIARLIWLKKHKPEIWDNVSSILEPKDYINFKLTGVFATDRISINASRDFFDAIQDDEQSFNALGIDRNILPRAISPFDEVGVVRNDLPAGFSSLIGKPVICGSTDTWTCVLGSGGLNPGAAYNISGTSDVFGVIALQKHECDGLMTVQWGPEQWQLGGPSQGAASRLTWAVERFLPGLSIEKAVSQAFERSSNPPIFLPFLEGERTPFWNADLRGAFIGVEHSHNGEDFVRSVAEGISFLSGLILKMAEAATGEEVAHICFSGGLSNNPVLCQLKADSLNRPVFVPDVKESGLIGSACMAFVSSDKIADITSNLLKSGTWFHPNEKSFAFYSERFSVFEDACSTVSDLSHRMANLSKAQLVQGA